MALVVAAVAAAFAAVAVLLASQFMASKTTFLGVGFVPVRNLAPSPCATVLGVGAEAMEPSPSSMVSIITSFGGPSLGELSGDSVGVDRVITIMIDGARASRIAIVAIGVSR